VPSLFRRKSDDLVEEAPAEVTPPPAENRPKAYTPSKKELGVATPKRSAAQRRRVNEPPPANRREALKRMREKQRAERTEAMEGMRSGDERYLMPRDQGPERALVRDIVDSRPSTGTYFFFGAFIVLAGSLGRLPAEVQLGLNLLWVALMIAMIVDGFLISRRVKKLVRQRFPKTQQRMGSLYLYGVMRAISFRRMRIPKARVKVGDKI
jgi:hypothetical protein